MPALAGTPRVRFVDPMLYPPLAHFSCGGSTRYEIEVDGIMQQLYSGKASGVAVRATEDADTGGLIGVCGLQPRPLIVPPGTTYADAAYVCVIGLTSAYRGGWHLPDGTRISDFILQDALAEITKAWGGGPMPPVWALIDPPNEKSHELFARHDFELIPAEPGGYDVRLRPRGLPLPDADRQPVPA